MNKRMKMGPVLVIGALVVLVAMAFMLTPAPPPATEDAHDHEEEAAKAPPPGEDPSAPKLDLEKIRQQLASGNMHAQSEAMQAVQAHYMTSRDQDKSALVPMIQKVALEAGGEMVRAQAVDMMRSFEGTSADFFLNVARNDRSPDVKRTALSALGSYKDNPEVEKLLNGFRGNPDPGLRATATISWISYLVESGTGGDTELAALLGQFDNDMAAKSAMALEQHGAAVLPLVTKILYTSQSGPQRHGAVMVISMVCAGYNPSIDAFARAAQVTHRQEAGPHSSNPTGVEPLIWALRNDTYAPSREMAAQGLGYIGDERAAQPLAEALRDKDKYVRRRAAAALITVPGEKAIPALSVAATTDQDADVRRFAVEALGWIGKAEGIPALVKATKDESPTVRRYAAIQLGKLADPSSLEALAAMLGDTPDKDDDVRWAAVVALGKLRDKRAVSVLVRSLDDASPQVQTSAERALQRLGVARMEREGFDS